MLAVLAAAATVGAAGGARQVAPPPQALPAITDAAVPQYPRDAVKAGAAGIVRIKVATDGSKITSVELQSSPPPQLGEAALRNIRTWRFAPHAPARFDVTFRFSLLDRPCDSLGRDTHAAATIHFPTEVDVFAERDAPCPGATPAPPVFGIYVREAAVPPYPAAARANGLEGTVRIGVSAKGELSVIEGPPDLGEPLVVAIRKWMLVPPPFADEMRFTFTLVDGDCRGGGGPTVTVGPGLTSYEIATCRR